MNNENIYNLLPVQRSILRKHQNLSDLDCDDVLSLILKIPQKLTIDIITKMITSLSNQHDALLFRLVEEQGIIYQKYYREPLTIEIISNRTMTTNDPTEALRNACIQKRRLIFSGESHPLTMVAVLFRNDETYIALSIHHIISDEISIKILKDDICTILDAFSKNENPNFPPMKPFRSLLGEQSKPINAHFWEEALSGLPKESGLTNGYPGRYERLTLELSLDIITRIDKFRRPLGMTRFMYFMTELAIFFSKIINTNDICIRTVADIRSVRGSRRTVGPLISPIAVRFEVDCDNYAETSFRAKRSLAASLANRSSFKIWDEKYPEVRTTKIMLAYNQKASENLRRGSTVETLWMGPVSSYTGCHEFFLQVIDVVSRIDLVVHFNANIYTPIEVRELFQDFSNRVSDT